MNAIKTFIKWFFIWIANIVPWLSWWTLAVIFWIYEKLINSIWNFLKTFSKKDFLFLFNIFIGAIIWIFIFAKVLWFLLEQYETQVSLIFFWLVLWSVPFLIKQISNKKVSLQNFFLLVFAILIVLFLNIWLNTETVENQNTINIDFLYWIKLLISWMIAASAMIIPWFSGSMLLIIIWEYYNIIHIVENFILEWILIIWVWAILWILTIVRLIKYLFENHKDITYTFIVWLILWSLYSIFPNEAIEQPTIINLLMFILWIITAYLFSKL